MNHDHDTPCLERRTPPKENDMNIIKAIIAWIKALFGKGPDSSANGGGPRPGNPR